MALGKPAIPTPNQLEIRSIATAISNARQRIEALEAVSGSTSGAVVQLQNTGETSLNTLRSLLDALDARIAALEGTIVVSDGMDTQLAVRAFMPHVPITQPVSSGSTPDDASTILAGQVFGD